MKEISRLIEHGGFAAFLNGDLCTVLRCKICFHCFELKDIEYDSSTVEEIEVIAKYEGYIVKQIKEAENMRKIEEMKIPAGLDYLNMDGLALEARQKLNKIQPLTIGQASRISGVNPSDISILLLNVRKFYEHE